jgi:outer membrane biosynthesis protein TonB
MANITHMQHDQFESKKNLQAGGYTAVICILMLVIFLFVRWTLPAPPPVPQDEGIEVNLGNSDQGLGEDQPFLPGQPSPQDQQSYTPPKVVAQETPEESKDVETDDKNEDAPEIRKPPVTKPRAEKVPEKEVVKSTPKKVTEPVTNPTPAPPKPKAVFKGVNGTGTGGNEADSYKKGGNQGVAGGTGDQGRPGGDPDSKNYTGPGGRGNSGVSISRGLQGRKIVKLPSFQDEFNENAKVAVDIKVDASGNVTSALYQPRGSTTADGTMKAIAIRKAMQVKFNSTGAESMGTIVFNFKLQN